MRRPGKILIVCYSFPPHPGIGGRRWAKFAKYLQAEGTAIHVFAAANYTDDISYWFEDVNLPGLKIHCRPFSFQKTLLHPQGLIEKIIGRLVRSALKLTRYTADIITSLPNRRLWTEVDELITRESITEVIVSGDPFLFYHVSRLPSRSRFRLTLDYRDLWNDHSFYSKNVTFTERQKRYFELAENTAVNAADQILFVDEHLKQVIRKRITNESVRLHVITNGFDPHDRSGALNPDNQAGTQIFFAGNVSSDLNSTFRSFLMQAAADAGESGFELVIFGNFDEAVIAGLPVTQGNVNIKRQQLHKKVYYRLLSASDIGVIVLSEEYRNSFTTKFYDYAFHGRFILSIGGRGEFANYIEERRIGVHLNPGDPEFFSKLRKAFDRRQQLSQIEIDRFDLRNITRQLISVLQ
jgi:hypothetical protein